MDKETITAVRSSMSSVSPDFWSVVGQTELDMFVSIAAGTLAHDVDALINDFRNHYARVSNERMWSSVFDNATFVLSKYRTRASPSELTAADRLLGELSRWRVIQHQLQQRDRARQGEALGRDP